MLFCEVDCPNMLLGAGLVLLLNIDWPKPPLATGLSASLGLLNPANGAGLSASLGLLNPANGDEAAGVGSTLTGADETPNMLAGFSVVDAVFTSAGLGAAPKGVDEPPKLGAAEAAGFGAPNIDEDNPPFGVLFVASGPLLRLPKTDDEDEVADGFAAKMDEALVVGALA